MRIEFDNDTKNTMIATRVSEKQRDMFKKYCEWKDLSMNDALGICVDKAIEEFQTMFIQEREKYSELGKEFYKIVPSDKRNSILDRIKTIVGQITSPAGVSSEKAQLWLQDLYTDLGLEIPKELKETIEDVEQKSGWTYREFVVGFAWSYMSAQE